MHLVHRKSRQWSFVAQNGDMDDAHFKYYAWELAPCVPSTSGRKTTAIVLAMPPWELTPTDLQCFAACTEASSKKPFTGSELIPLTSYTQFPLFSEAGRARFNDDQRVWGKASSIRRKCAILTLLICAPQLYDICVAKESPYFVVTNYYGWVFGVFSKGM